MEAYRKIIPVTRKGRAKDFYDIYIIDRESPIKFSILENFETLKTCFIIKKVPIRFLKEIYKEREFHRDSFQSVIDSVYVSEGIRSYDFYFLCEEEGWEEKYGFFADDLTF